MRFLQMRRSITLFGLCSAGGVLRVLECLLKPGLILAKISLLLQMRSDLLGQRAQLCVQLGQTGKLMTLRRELFQPLQGLALLGLALPQGLRLLQLFASAMVLFFQFTQGFKP